MNSLLARLLPFLFLGIFVVILVAGIILFSYLLILGAIAGFILFAIAWLRDKLFPNRPIIQRKIKKPESGRIIDHDDYKDK